MTTPEIQAYYRVKRAGNWPMWARLIRSRRLPGDRGVGDTVEHLHGLIGSDGFRFWHYCVFGDRRACPKCPSQWNKRYPYNPGVLAL